MKAASAQSETRRPSGACKLCELKPSLSTIERLAAEAGLIRADTPVVTTVHPDQIVAPGEIPVVDHDFRLDLLVTADEVVVCEHGAPREPGRVRWDDLTEDKIAAIPLLGRLRPTGRGT